MDHYVIQIKDLLLNLLHSNEESALQLQNDLELLAFNRTKIHKQTQTSTFGKNTNDPRKVTHTCYVHSYTTHFTVLLIALGVIFGKRTKQISSIPNFIKCVRKM